MREIPTLIDMLNKLPSVDRLVNDSGLTEVRSEHGLHIVTDCVKGALKDARALIREGESIEKEQLVKNVNQQINNLTRASLKPVINLSGTILNTNLGRAVLPASAIKAMVEVSINPTNLEFDIENGKRHDRQYHVESLLRELTGAESALVVNNNAAAMLLVLNTLANKKEVPVSRGELVEIGGSFRIPDIMARSGCKLVEVGSTNRTHENDFEMAISSRTALIMKVHTSNFEIKGFVKSLTESELAKVAKRHSLPLITDLGSGALIELKKYNLPHEMMVTEALASGANLVTFSGDKLLGGPQAGIIVGQFELVEKLKRNPMFRAIRPDKITIAALQAVLRLYRNPQTLENELPTLRFFNRDLFELEKLAQRLVPIVQNYCKGFKVDMMYVETQIGSGALPSAGLPSVALQITSLARRAGKSLNSLAKSFRNLPIPVIGRIAQDKLIFDLKCLEDEKLFIENLCNLKIS